MCKQKCMKEGDDREFAPICKECGNYTNCPPPCNYCGGLDYIYLKDLKEEEKCSQRKKF